MKKREKESPEKKRLFIHMAGYIQWLYRLLE